MPQSDLSSLKSRISAVVEASPLGSHIRQIAVETGQAEDGSDFLRVLVEFDSLIDVSDEQLEELTALIEAAVDAVDQPFPSIRFSEAA